MDPLEIVTSRLRIRWLDRGDAEFILELVNDPDWIHYIGDKGISSLEQARQYIETAIDLYLKLGLGLNRVSLLDDDLAIGICGLLQRASLDVPDLGFAFLPSFRNQGYAFESAQAVLRYSRDSLEIRRVLAIVSPDNGISRSLLLKLGFAYKDRCRMEPNSEFLDLYEIKL